MNTKKLLPILILAIIVVGGLAFYGGMKYGQKNANGGTSNLANLTPEQQQQRFAQMAGSGSGRRVGQGGGVASGEIIAKDDKSVTIKLQSGGSQIVFLSSTTQVGKFVTGSAGDLIIGENVMANGSANTDGSITAQSIQIRPVPTATPSK